MIRALFYIEAPDFENSRLGTRAIGHLRMFPMCSEASSSLVVPQQKKLISSFQPRTQQTEQPHFIIRRAEPGLWVA